jgi:glycerophosphoryl diester phosphodiesterase
MLELTAARSGKILVIGHRGALGYAPENTMASFEKGLTCRADVLELDVHLTRDGELVVMHDADVARTTDGHGRVRDMTLAEIKRLDAGKWFGPEFAGQRVPTLAEVLAWARSRAELAVEIKGDPLPLPGIEEKVVTQLHAHGMADRVIIISFYHPTVRCVKEIDPAIATGVLYAGLLADTVGNARAARADSVRPNWAYWTADLVAQVHAAGLTASAWNADDEQLMAYVVGLGVDSCGSNYPDRLRAFLDRRGLSWQKSAPQHSNEPNQADR